MQTSEELQRRRIQTVLNHMRHECELDWDAVIATFEHPRYEMHGSGAVHDGEREVRDYFAASRDAFPDQANEVIAIAACGDTVLVEFWLTGTHLGDFQVGDRRYPPTGRAFRTRMAATFEFAPGAERILCERPYSCADAKLRALGLA